MRNAGAVASLMLACLVVGVGCQSSMSFNLPTDKQGAEVVATGPFEGTNFEEIPFGNDFTRIGKVYVPAGGPYESCVAIDGTPLTDFQTWVSMQGASDTFPNNIGLNAAGCMKFVVSEHFNVLQVRTEVKIRINDATHHDYVIIFDNGASAPLAEIAGSHYITDWPPAVIQNEVRSFTLLKDNGQVDPQSAGLDIRILTEKDIQSTVHPCLDTNNYSFTFVIPQSNSECSIR